MICCKMQKCEMLFLRERDVFDDVIKVHTCSQKDEENKNNAIVDSKTQETGLQSLLCTVGHFILYIYFFSEAWTSANPKIIWSRCPVKCLKDQNVNSNTTETHTFQNIKRVTKKQTQK